MPQLLKAMSHGQHNHHHYLHDTATEQVLSSRTRSTACSRRPAGNEAEGLLQAAGWGSAFIIVAVGLRPHLYGKKDGSWQERLLQVKHLEQTYLQQRTFSCSRFAHKAGTALLAQTDIGIGNLHSNQHKHPANQHW